MLSASLKKKLQRPPFIAYGGGGAAERNGMVNWSAHQSLCF